MTWKWEPKESFPPLYCFLSYCVMPATEGKLEQKLGVGKERCWYDLDLIMLFIERMETIGTLAGRGIEWWEINRLLCEILENNARNNTDQNFPYFSVCSHFFCTFRIFTLPSSCTRHYLVISSFLVCSAFCSISSKHADWFFLLQLRGKSQSQEI